jgi:hypothetical protein
MGQEPEELRRDIERRREELGDTIDAIGDRVSPGRIIERRRNRMSDGVRGFKDRVMGTVSSGTGAVSGAMSSGTSAVGGAAGSVRDHMSPDAVKQQTTGSPLGAGLVAFGIGFLVAAALPSTDTEAGVAASAQDALEPAKEALVESAKSVAADLKDEASQKAQDVSATASEAASGVTDTARQQATAAKQDAQDLKPS